MQGYRKPKFSSSMCLMMINHAIPIIYTVQWYISQCGKLGRDRAENSIKINLKRNKDNLSWTLSADYRDYNDNYLHNNTNKNNIVA